MGEGDGAAPRAGEKVGVTVDRMIMRVILGTALLAAMISSSAIGAPILLTCVPTDPPASTNVRVEVDVENRWMTFGDSTYDIVRLDDRYITATNQPDNIVFRVGGEVLVLDRVAGELKRAVVAVGMTAETILDSEKNPLSKSVRILAGTYTAQCSKPLL